MPNRLRRLLSVQSALSRCGPPTCKPSTRSSLRCKLLTDHRSLLGCEHVFCENCLYEQFSATLNNYKEAYPLPAHLHPPPPPEALMPLTQSRVPYEMKLHGYRVSRGEPEYPEYRCPTCGEEVMDRPVEDSGMRNVVRRKGCTPPDEYIRHRPTMNDDEGIWEIFFGHSPF
jgi:hypothetical protein